jgi:uncharacterized protein
VSPSGAKFVTMASPFVYEKPVAPEDLVDREAELEELVDRALDARNSRLEGPRRFGKTSLISAALAQCERHDAIPIRVDFLGCVSAVDVAERIERSYSAQLDSRLRRWFDGLIRTLQPTVTAAPGGVGVRAQPRVTTPGLLDRLALPRRIHARTGRMCVVAFDEFQEVLKLGASLPGVFRSELEDQGSAASYIFSGSHPGLMRQMFSDRRHAFFAQARPITIGALPADALADFIASRFEQSGRELGDTLGPLLDVAEGHPQRAMLLAHHLYQRITPAQPADVELWLDALDGARAEALGEIQVLWGASTELERRVLKVIAHRSVSLGGREAEARFGLAKGGSATAAIERLVADGHVIADETTRTGWRIVDPFLAAWLRDE